MPIEIIKAFEPIANKDCEVLILGTMPGERSLELQQYYGHTGNHFWKIMFNLFNEPFSRDYNDKIKLLLKNKIALWDVLSHCERKGSADSNIRQEIVNDFKAFYKTHPKIKAVFLDSKTAEKLYDKHVGRSDTRKYFLLPSPSGANASVSFERKLVHWKQILKALNESSVKSNV